MDRKHILGKTMVNRVTAGKGPIQKAGCGICEGEGGVDSESPLQRGTVHALTMSQVCASQ